MKQMDSKEMRCAVPEKQISEEECIEEQLPKHFSIKHGLVELEAAAYAMASIKKIEMEKERREKNRLAAKKSREKKIHYVEEMEQRLYFENKRNQKMHQDINTLYTLLEKILYETEILIEDNHLEATEIANIFIAHEKYVNFPTHHREIIDNLKYLLFANRSPKI